MKLISKIKIVYFELENIVNKIDNDEIVYYFYYSKLLYEENIGSLDTIIIYVIKLKIFNKIILCI
ncbi:MAG: hypothetical protein IPL21_08760 [Saprospirales bacterium]|nr:hypothetical protein [Saprospirales bacterium]